MIFLFFHTAFVVAAGATIVAIVIMFCVCTGGT